MYGGASAEQYVGQEISAANHTELYFWSREAKNSSAEIEFLIERRGQILPIEVKSGVSEKLKDLHILLKTYQNVSSGYVLSAHPFSEIPEQKLVFCPIYKADRISERCGNTYSKIHEKLIY